MPDDPRIPEVLQRLASDCGGTIEEVHGPLPDGSGFATMSLPLPADHWLTAPGDNDPPMPQRVGMDDPRRRELVEQVEAAARYAVRATTSNGAVTDFDPDAWVSNMVVGLLGCFTPDGLSHADEVLLDHPEC